MTVEEAISRLEDHTQYYVPIDDLEAFEMAVDALRAQQTPAKLDRSRWERCEMCTAKYTKKDWNTENVGAHEFRVSGDSLMYCDQFYGWEGIRIKFCPHCGRPLTEEAWAELEMRIGGNNGTTDWTRQ